MAEASRLRRGEAKPAVGKGIDACHDATCELRSESHKTADTVRDPCWQGRQRESAGRDRVRVQNPPDRKFPITGFAISPEPSL
jgi:hypothetical protein